MLDRHASGIVRQRHLHSCQEEGRRECGVAAYSGKRNPCVSSSASHVQETQDRSCSKLPQGLTSRLESLDLLPMCRMKEHAGNFSVVLEKAVPLGLSLKLDEES